MSDYDTVGIPDYDLNPYGRGDRDVARHTRTADATGLRVGDRVVILGGFEDGLVGTITSIDVSGTVRSWPRYRVQTETVSVGGLMAANLERIET